MITRLDRNKHEFFRKKLIEDIDDRARPFHKDLVAKQELERYLISLSEQYPDMGISPSSARFSFKKLCVLLELEGGIHLKYNATVKGKTINLNIWVIRDHYLYLAQPRGDLIGEWKAQAAAEAKQQ
jgi:hypothetical protein